MPVVLGLVRSHQVFLRSAELLKIEPPNLAQRSRESDTTAGQALVAGSIRGSEFKRNVMGSETMPAGTEQWLDMDT